MKNSALISVSPEFAASETKVKAAIPGLSKDISVCVYKITPANMAARACSFTEGRVIPKVTMDVLYRAEHSPIRTQIFWIEMFNIPTFVSVHLVRHKIGVEHFVQSNREDRGGDITANRLTPINHAMLANANALINMARKRLCNRSHLHTQGVMAAITLGVYTLDAPLAKAMVPECRYRGQCPEFKPCGQQIFDLEVLREKCLNDVKNA